MGMKCWRSTSQARWEALERHTKQESGFPRARTQEWILAHILFLPFQILLDLIFAEPWYKDFVLSSVPKLIVVSYSSNKNAIALEYNFIIFILLATCNVYMIFE